MGLGIIGTMTGPLLVVLHTIPRSLFAGVFLVVGVSSNTKMPRFNIVVNDALTSEPQWGSLEGSGITKKILYLISEPRFVQRDEPLLQLRKRRILLYISWQILGIALSVAISQTIAAIGKSPYRAGELTHFDRAMSDVEFIEIFKYFRVLHSANPEYRFPCHHARSHTTPLESPSENLHRQRIQNHGCTYRQQRCRPRKFRRKTSIAGG